MSKKMIVLDQAACTGCRQCELVCSVKHTGEANPARSRINVIKWERQGYYLPVYCQHCAEPACAAVCPKNAISRDKDTDRVEINRNLCIGCRMCVMACPFGAVAVDAKLGKSWKCDHCEGEPTCVTFCEAGALKYLDSDTANLAKKRAAGQRLAELMRVGS